MSIIGSILEFVVKRGIEIGERYVASRYTQEEIARLKAERDAALSRAAKAEVDAEAMRLVELERKRS